MRAALLLIALTGCYVGGRGGVDTTLGRSDRSTSAPQGAVDFGLYGADEKQLLVLMAGVGASPLVAAADDPAAPRVPVFSLGGRYERAFSPARPWLRGFGRLMLGGGWCTDEDAMAEEPASSCDTPEERRSVSVTSLALGVALTVTGDEASDQFVPPVASLGLAVVYTYASDEALGAADFLGLELSAGFGGDLLSGLLDSEDD